MRHRGMNRAGRGARETWRKRAVGWKTALVASAVLALAGCATAHADESAPGETEAAEAGARVVNVATTPAAVRTFREKVTVQGNLEARQSAQVGPKITGTLAEVFVDEGDRVVAGETPLFRTDDAKLKKVVEANRAALSLAKSGVRQARAAQTQAAANLKMARRNFERHEALHATHSVSEEAFERVETGYAQARAAKDQAKAAVQLARDRVRQAEVALAMAEQDLADATVVAPVSGIVTRRMREPGELGIFGPGGQPIIQIDDPSFVEVSAFLPANVYARVDADQTSMKVAVYGADMGVIPISYKSPTIDPNTRTFEVRGLLDNPEGTVAPGAMAEITVVLAEARSLGVPERAVVVRNGTSHVFVLEGEQARMLPVTTGLENDGWVALTGAELGEGTPIVTVGQSMLEDGMPVFLTNPQSSTDQ